MYFCSYIPHTRPDPITAITVETLQKPFIRKRVQECVGTRRGNVSVPVTMPPKKTTKERRESSLSDNYNNQVTQQYVVVYSSARATRDFSFYPHHLHRTTKFASALVSTSKEIGIATGILPVVSTLTFGFATNVLLDSNSQAPATVLILVSLCKLV